MLNLEAILKRNNVKSTAMRLLVLQFLLTKKVAISLTDLENDFEKSDRTTLYRTLQTFVKSELAHKIEDGTGIPKYALCDENCHCDIERDLHLHFHCKKCNETTCITDSKIPQINVPEGFLIEGISLIATGVCNKCNR